MILTLCYGLTKDQAALNEVARQMQLSAGGGDGGQYTFTQPIYEKTEPDDSTPFGYWTVVNFTAEGHAQAESELSQFPGSVMEDYDPLDNPGFPDQWLAANNLRRALPKLP